MRPNLPGPLSLLIATRVSLALLVGVILSGCGGSSTAPTAPSATDHAALATGGASKSIAQSGAQLAQSTGGDFYPLSVGNLWQYSRAFSLGDEVGPPYDIRSAVTRELIGTETLLDRSYVVEEERTVQDTRPGELFRTWTRYRQDRAGLYYADVCGCDPPILDGGTGGSASQESSTRVDASTPSWEVLKGRYAPEQQPAFEAAYARLKAHLNRARHALEMASARMSRDPGPPGGANDSEVGFLKYPLHVGSSWSIREDIRLTWTVEGVERIDLPGGQFTAYRIRVRYEGMQPDDEAIIWYGRSGRLAHRLHLSGIATDSDGNPIGTFTSDESEELVGLSLKPESR